MHVTAPRVLGPLLTVVLLSGCHSSPPRLSELGPEGSAALWRAEEGSSPAKGTQVRRVAVAELSLELVTHKWIAPLPGALLLDPTMYSDVGIAIQLLGLGRRTVGWGALEETLPARLHAAFLDGLRARGLEVVPPAQVARTKAWQDYARLERDGSSLVRWLNPIGHDTGRIRGFDVLPAPGLAVIDGAQGDREVGDVDAALLAETGADLVIRARFRLGIHEGRASIETGSELQVTARGQHGVVSSQRSLTSDEDVASAWFLPFMGLRYDLDPKTYTAAADGLFASYRDGALDALGLPDRLDRRLAAARR